MTVGSLHFDHEDTLGAKLVPRVEHPCIVGVDEVGYGAWAGDIVVAAAWINRHSISKDFLKQLADSKALSPKKRLYLSDLFIQNPTWGSYAVVRIPVLNIVQGLVLKHTLRAMMQAINQLDCSLGETFPRAVSMPLVHCRDEGEGVHWREEGEEAHWREKGEGTGFLKQTGFLKETGFLKRVQGVIVDGLHALPMTILQKPCPGADGQSYSVALASILAKVARDQEMVQLSLEYPEYRWENNKGYGTRAHQQAIAQHGLSKHHRIFYCKKFMDRMGL